MTGTSTRVAGDGDYAFGAESPRERQINDRVADGMLLALVSHGFVPDHQQADWAMFQEWQELVHTRFDVPVSSITTRMARLLYAVSRATRPRTIVCAGSAWGNALVWLAGGSPGAECIGVDIDPGCSAVAVRNFEAIGRDARILVEDARAVADQLPQVELLLLDADDAETGKGILVPILESLSPVLHPGSLVLAHDSALPTFAEDFVAFRAALVARAAQKTINVPIDRCGLEVTLL